MVPLRGPQVMYLKTLSPVTAKIARGLLLGLLLIWPFVFFAGVSSMFAISIRMGDEFVSSFQKLIEVAVFLWLVVAPKVMYSNYKESGQLINGLEYFAARKLSLWPIKITVGLLLLHVMAVYAA